MKLNGARISKSNQSYSTFCNTKRKNAQKCKKEGVSKYALCISSKATAGHITGSFLEKKKSSKRYFYTQCSHLTSFFPSCTNFNLESVA